MLQMYFLAGPSVFEILANGFEAVSGIFYFLSYALLVWSVYRSMIYVIYFILRNRLNDKNLEDFVRILGDNYTFKKLGDGDKRFRWVKWYGQVKANFDSEGYRIYSRIEPFRFWHYDSVVSFI